MLIIRADGNSKIGTGHIMRCLAVAERIRERESDVVFAVADQESNRLLAEKEYKTVILDSDYTNMSMERDKIRELIRSYSPTAFLVDSYFADRDYFQMLREIFPDGKIIAFDDLHSDIFPVDLLIHYGIGGERRKEQYIKDYREAGADVPKLLLGESFAPLRHEFLGIPGRKIQSEVKNVLVLTGGSDVSHTTVQMLEYLAKNQDFSKIRFHFVVGKLNPDKERIHKISESVLNAVIHTDVKNMRSLMEDADLAVSAGGTTLMEICACGTPLITFVCADNQIEGVADVVKKTNAVFAGDARNNPDLINDIFSAILLLGANENLRREISRKEQETIDGKGADRIADEIMQLMK